MMAQWPMAMAASKLIQVEAFSDVFGMCGITFFFFFSGGASESAGPGVDGLGPAWSSDFDDLRVPREPGGTWNDMLSLTLVTVMNVSFKSEVHSIGSFWCAVLWWPSPTFLAGHVSCQVHYINHLKVTFPRGNQPKKEQRFPADKV